VPTYHLSYNIAPTQLAPVIVNNKEKQRVCKMMRWGLVPGWSKGPDPRFNMINAKAETIEQKPAYKTPFQRKRCLVPCDGFYEWQAIKAEGEKSGKAKQPYYIHKQDNSLLVMAGIWDVWPSNAQASANNAAQLMLSFSIITTDANPLMQNIHQRMPVLLRPEQFATWLSVDDQDPETLKSLLVPYQGDDLRMHPVSRQVNSPKNDSAELIQEVNL
jgi:putative SOS response-associated peptidase YedK